MKKTKIVCTIGPASEDKEILKTLIKSGMNVMRMNFSHGDYNEQGQRIKTLRELGNEDGWHRYVGVMLDTQGPEIRTGMLKDNKPVELVQGKNIRVTMDYSHLGDAEKIAISYAGLYDDIAVGGKILIEDGNITLTVLEKDVTVKELVCRIENSRLLKNRKNCNIPGVVLNMPYVSEKDRTDMEFACDNGVDYIAASFVRRADDIRQIREILKAKNNTHIKIISKIENQEGVENMVEIIELSDGVMVARGDLGVDVDAWELPTIQKDMTFLAQAQGKIVVTATQMLESMQQNPRPTRAEVSDIHNAVLDGTSATMLSGESAQGDYPVESVTYMAKINERAEDDIDNESMIQNVLSFGDELGQEDALGLAVAQMAHHFSIKAIIAEGDFKLLSSISKFRPDADIFAAVDSAEIARSLSLVWGVRAVVGDFNKAIEYAKVRYTVVKRDVKAGDVFIKVTDSKIELINM